MYMYMYIIYVHVHVLQGLGETAHTLRVCKVGFKGTHIATTCTPGAWRSSARSCPHQRRGRVLSLVCSRSLLTL